VSNNSSGMCCGVSQNTYHTLKDMRVVFVDGTVLDTADPVSRESFLRVRGGAGGRVCLWLRLVGGRRRRQLQLLATAAYLAHAAHAARPHPFPPPSTAVAPLAVRGRVVARAPRAGRPRADQPHPPQVRHQMHHGWVLFRGEGEAGRGHTLAASQCCSRGQGEAAAPRGALTAGASPRPARPPPQATPSTRSWTSPRTTPSRSSSTS
jgi:hypothetical protein